MTNKQKAENMTKGFIKEGLIKKSRLQELLIKAMDWKDKQFAKEKQEWIDKACIELCKNCSQLYGNCEEWCKRKPAFQKAMRGE